MFGVTISKVSSEHRATADVSTLPAAGSNRLVVTFLDVRQGDSIFIRTPGKKTILIDGGSRGNEYSTYDGGYESVVPFLEAYGIKSLDLVVATHPHNDHIGGLIAVLENFPVKSFLDPGLVYASATYEHLLTLVKTKGIAYEVAERGSLIELDPAILLQILAPSQTAGDSFSAVNNASIVLRLVYRDVSFLLTGDIEREVETDVLNFGHGIKSTFLKVPHHGSDTSSSEFFVQQVRPAVGIVSVGKYNKFGHPSKEVLERYQAIGTKLYRTDVNGNVTVITDGFAYNVITER